jgi:hypothetical protein
MFRVGLVAVAIVLAMVLVKDRSHLERAGVLSTCTPVAAPAGDNFFWEACTSGRLEGRPSLARRSCESVRVVGRVEYWRCPSQITSSATP